MKPVDRGQSALVGNVALEAMEMVTVYRYRRLNFRTDAVSVEPGKASARAIGRMVGCSILEGSAEQVPADALDEQGIYQVPVAHSRR